MSIFWSEFRIFGVMTHALVQPNAFVTSSFCDLAARIASIGRGNLRKNTARPNELADFEKFKVEHPPRIKTILDTTSAVSYTHLTLPTKRIV